LTPACGIGNAQELLKQNTHNNITGKFAFEEKRRVISRLFFDYRFSEKNTQKSIKHS